MENFRGLIDSISKITPDGVTGLLHKENIYKGCLFAFLFMRNRLAADLQTLNP